MTDLVSNVAEAVRDEVREHKTLYVIQSVLMILLGVLAAVFPVISAASFAIVLGWLMVFGGVAQAISLIAVGKVPNFWLQLVSAILGIVVGLIFLLNPGIALSTVTLLMVVYLMATGSVKVALSLGVRPLPSWGWILAAGVITLLLATYLLFNPAVAVVTLGLFLGLQLISEGIALFMLTRA